MRKVLEYIHTEGHCGEAGREADIKVMALRSGKSLCTTVSVHLPVLHADMWAPGETPQPPPSNAGASGTLTHLLDGGLQGDVQVVHSRQLHRLIDALGCQRVSSENGVGVPGKQHRVIFVSSVQQGEKGSRPCSWAPVHGTQKHTRPVY